MSKVTAKDVRQLAARLRARECNTEASEVLFVADTIEQQQARIAELERAVRGATNWLEPTDDGHRKHNMLFARRLLLGAMPKEAPNADPE